MSEVTAKDLREAIWLGTLSPHHTQRDAIAAFDAMAEKTELFDKQDKLLKQMGALQFDYLDLAELPVQLYIQECNSKYQDVSLAEALKAVPE